MAEANVAETNSSPTQRDQVLQYMQDNGSITPLDALRDIGCLRLSARIFELRKEGHKIGMTIITKPQSKVHYANYYLEEQERDAMRMVGE